MSLLEVAAMVGRPAGRPYQDFIIAQIIAQPSSENKGF
jgi:hypothetical protein